MCLVLPTDNSQIFVVLVKRHGAIIRRQGKEA